MKFKPILFSTPMVQAILEGRKTQTRRIIKPQPLIMSDNNHFNFEKEYYLTREDLITKSKIQEGDILWVRETFRLTDFLHPSDDNYGYIYKASENGREWESNDEGWTWKPSIFMPKAACRIFLLVTHVRVERLQDISEDDAISEGIESYFSGLFQEFRYKDYSKAGPGRFKPQRFWRDGNKLGLGEWRSPGSSFQSLWQSINGKESWNENPWVWVYEFEQIKKPENFK